MLQRILLTVLWWLWGIALLILLIFLSLQPAIFGQDTQKIWQWFLPNILPTLTMVGAAAYAAPQPTVGAPAAPAMLFLFALGTSILYLLALTFSIIFSAFYQPNAPLDFLNQSSLWLGPLQGFVSSALAFYFVKK
jgi:hypothetical protein